MDDLLIDIEEAEKRITSMHQELNIMREEYLKRRGWEFMDGLLGVKAYAKGDEMFIDLSDAMDYEIDGPGCKEANDA